MVYGFPCGWDEGAGLWSLCRADPALLRESWGWSCWLFVPARLPWDCTHIQLLKGGSSRASSFSIQLFQMLNHSVAYLHCQLRVCLPGQPGCEQVLRVPLSPQQGFGIWCFQSLHTRSWLTPRSPHGHPILC